jgi:hypothetical protein
METTNIKQPLNAGRGTLYALYALYALLILHMPPTKVQRTVVNAFKAATH